ncbi:ABC transporter ATP-binding protein [Azoarcus taiwanensis]|uniref:ATP-binding cassette domain-containing protein n=1 Tax=Azoarcus taiwanensis TaxID=666964 RepID=A0A972FBE1_9RHOO|nr:ABC transporter ATP-binding protein [Azoarcus taiwanensis]NMG01500.1 ATP-binding cassette domain-containing protein [Azoarcus taiwanensis]
MPELRLHAFQTHHVGPIELAVAAGECVCLRGASGSGKTLLLRAIADLDPHQGEAWLDGAACSQMPAPVWRRKVMLVAAESHWWAERVGTHFPSDYDPDRLRELDLTPDALHWEVTRCSTGERQRLALLLEEPTGNLDPDTTAAVERLLDDYRTRNEAPMLWVSHDTSQIQRVADRGFVLEDGALRETS